MVHKSFLILIILTFSAFLLFGQTDESYKVYDDSEVAVVRISMDQNDLVWMFENPTIDSMHLAEVHFQNGQIDEVVDSVGVRIRGNTSRISSKKSIKLSFNSFKKGGKFYSLEKLNLNGEHNDPSIARSKICWDFFNDFEMVSSRAAHLALYINDEYYGLYISVEHVDENFVTKNFIVDSGNLWKCLYGADLNYIDDNPDSYKIGSGSSRVYDLKTNRNEGDYSKLAELIDFLNNTDEVTFKNEISNRINVLNVLQHFAANVVLGSWDDYWANVNNYYLYHEPATDLFYIIPYDYDNTLGISWFSIDWTQTNPYLFAKITGGYRPLIERILTIPEYRNLYTHILDFFNQNRFKTSLAGNKINDIKNMIMPWAIDDVYRTMDYGFTIDDFTNSYFENGYSKFHVRYSIQEYITRRFNVLSSQLNYVESDPVVYDVNISDYLYSSDSISLGCSAFSNLGIAKVQAEIYNNNLQTTELVELSFTPDINSMNISHRDRWEIRLAPLSNGFSGVLKIVVEDNNGNIVKFPSEGIDIVMPGEVSKELLLTELMSSNASTIQDNFGEYDDWLEIYNPQDTAISLSGKYLTDKRDNLNKWQFPENVTIQPGQFILIWCDEDQEQSGPHINFKLSSNGEFVAIVDNDGFTFVDSVTLPTLNADESYARFNNVNEWSVSNTPTPGESNLITSVKDEEIDNFQFKLEAYPNPFNPLTTLEYEIAKSMDIQLNIYDILGRLVWQTVKQKKEAGRYSVQWNGTDNKGNELASGLYILQVFGESYSKTIKLLLLR